VLLVSLEKDAEALSQRHLELLLGFVLFLENLNIFFVECILLISTFSVLLLIFSILLDSVF
jgi:hypothetical protein